MILTTYDRGMADGLAIGKRKALRMVIIQLASSRCGKPHADTRKKIHEIEDVARLEDLVEAATTAQSWEQLLAAK
jgi:hypothetical protein